MKPEYRFKIVTKDLTSLTYINPITYPIGEWIESSTPMFLYNIEQEFAELDFGKFFTGKQRLFICLANNPISISDLKLLMDIRLNIYDMLYDKEKNMLKAFWKGVNLVNESMLHMFKTYFDLSYKIKLEKEIDKDNFSKYVIENFDRTLGNPETLIHYPVLIGDAIAEAYRQAASNASREKGNRVLHRSSIIDHLRDLLKQYIIYSQAEEQ